MEINRLENMIKTLQNDLKTKADKTDHERLRYEVDGKQDAAQFRAELRRTDGTLEGHNHQIHDCVLKAQETTREHEQLKQFVELLQKSINSLRNAQATTPPPQSNSGVDEAVMRQIIDRI